MQTKRHGSTVSTVMAAGWLAVGWLVNHQYDHISEVNKNREDVALVVHSVRRNAIHH